MKILLSLIILSQIIFSCSKKQSTNEEKLSPAETQQQKEQAFKLVVDFPAIIDSTKFIFELKQTFNLFVHESPAQKENEKITAYKKVKLYGSNKDFIFIEYNRNVGSMAEFPWKYQLLLTTEGKLIKIFTALRFDFVTIFQNQNPFLLTLKATAKGNGGHEIYKISSDTLENVYEGYYNFNTQTYDAHQDNFVFEPNELNIEFTDINKDGFNDIVFSGQKIMLGRFTKDSTWYDNENGKTFSVNNPADRIPIIQTFLYDKNTGHFKKN